MRKNILAVVFLVFCSILTAQQPQTVPETPAMQQTPPAASVTEKPRVFVTDSESWEMQGSQGGGHGSYGGESHGGARPQTAEIIKTFGQRCPDVAVNNKQELATTSSYSITKVARAIYNIEIRSPSSSAYRAMPW